MTDTAIDTDPTVGPLPRRSEDDAQLVARLGRFILLERIGQGGMGVVHAAYDTELDRRVAIKLVRPDEWSRRDTRARGRALAEARAMAQVSHPNVVTVYEVGSLDDGIYVAMELVRGATVRTWAAQPRAWRDVVEVFVQLAHGLAAVHDAGLVHRDVKPDNTMIRDDGRAQLLDFGIARAAGGAPDSDERGTSSAIAVVATAEDGQLVGTPAYMSPEQYLGRPADAASDQWALCIALYEALYARRPFEATTLVDLSAKIVGDELPAPPRERAVPRRLHAVLARGLDKKPERRWPSIRALGEALGEVLQRPARRRRLAVLGAGVVVLGAWVLWGIRPQPGCDDAGAPIDAVWHEARQHVIGHAFVTAAPSWGAEAWTRTAAMIDTRAEAWRAERRDACTAARVTGLQSEHVLDLRNHCLERALGELSALLDAFEHVASDEVESSLPAVLAMGDVDACRDVGMLLEGVPLPSPEQAVAVAELHQRLAIAEAEFQLGRVDDSRQRQADVLREAEALGYLPLVAESELSIAQSEAFLGEHLRALESSDRGYLVARRAGDHVMAAHGAASLAVEIASERRNIDEALRMLRFADVELPAEGAARARMHVAEARAVVLLLAGRHGEALAAIDELRRLLPSVFSDEMQRAAKEAEIDELAVTALPYLGRADEAIELGRRALEINERIYGTEHPTIATTLISLGEAYSDRGDYREAVPLVARAVEMRVRTLGPDHVSVGKALAHLAIVERALDGAAARQHCARAIEIFERALGPEAPDIMSCLTTIGRALRDGGDGAAARDAFARALTIAEATFGPEHSHVAVALTNLAMVELDLGMVVEGELHARGAISLWETTRGEDDPMLATPLFYLGRILEQAGRSEDAAAALERSLKLRSPSTPVEERAATLFALAISLVTRDPVRAIALVREARDHYTRAQSPQAAAIAKIDAWLAEHDEPARRPTPPR